MRFVVNVLASLSIFVVAGTSAADVHVGAGGGYFEPWEGEGGFSVMGQVLWSTGSERFRFGGEIGYTPYDTDFLGVSHVDVQSIPNVRLPSTTTPRAISAAAVARHRCS